jgi:AmmeMemoRadiSam system protein B/AmmeMemoRadiSam system protein A
MRSYIEAFIIILIALAGLSKAESTTIRQPAVAGTFYPADPQELSKMVEGHLAGVADLPPIDGQIMALIVPHAGLVYSGRIAAYAYKLLENSGISKVILCGPSHHYRFDGAAVYGNNIVWQTPLGNVACDDAVCLKLIKFDDKIRYMAEPHDKEHCLEVQLPYLQSVLDTFTIVPIVLGVPNINTIDALAKALESLTLDDKTIMIASTDWQHYRPAAEGWKMDSTGIECLKDLDPDKLGRLLSNGTVEMCGGGAVMAVMKAAVAKGANKIKILKYGDSGDATGDKSSVVGYVAAVIYKSDDSGRKAAESKSSASSKEGKLPEKFSLSKDEKATLLKIARESIKCHLLSQPVPVFNVSENLSKPGAAFVTLEKNQQLRGCIGYTTASLPLYKTVSECAVKAAVEDWRFPAVRPEELDSLHIEISVLTPLQKVESLEEITVGRDGLMIFEGQNRGLLLPQVATENNWNKIVFLEQTCRKAGLPQNAYKDPEATLYKFQAVIFGE